MQKGGIGGAARDAKAASFLQTLSSVEEMLGLGESGTGKKKAALKPPSPKAMEAAQKIVSQLFFLPVVESMRDFPFGKGVGYGGRTEDAFGQQLDVRIADVMAGADRSGLVEKMARKFEARR
ncbi:MAG: hypothetical protein SF069_05200 [Phycisphaerae bacterium]|nr:hypothetical protein [Phycisphaerae bacterium]